MDQYQKLADDVFSAMRIWCTRELDSRIKNLAIPRGEKGADGVNGKDGSDGKDGIDGKNGTDGSLGKDGLDGKDGAPGSNGQDGAPGSNGKDGSPGTNGKDGSPGLDGKDGAPGIDGKDGAPGLIGKDGAAGRDGIDGKDGADGLIGKDGAHGRNGMDGKDGAPGLIGKDGVDGLNGRDGVDGVDGREGKQGEKGADGQSFTLKEVRPILEAEIAKWALEFERRSSDVLQRAIERMPVPKDGEPGFSLDDFDFVSKDDGRILAVSLKSGQREIVREARTAVLIYRDVFQPGRLYQRGDTVTYGGSLWTTVKDATGTERPGDGSGTYRLSVKKGEAGRDGS